jgi:hypothetical protein
LVELRRARRTVSPSRMTNGVRTDRHFALHTIFSGGAYVAANADLL